MRSEIPVRAVFALLVSLAAVGGPAVAPATAAPEDCFGDGRDLDVGTEGPTIDLSVYTSLFSNLGGEGAFGISAVGSTGEVEVISLRTGVVFAGVGDPGEFLADPFSRFAIAFDYRLSLPMLAAAPGDDTYEQSESPVEGVPEAECSVD
ncbi:hypothetical protein Hbl1158_06770 [Halobaculum sp. CBA1158]|uniref:DUF7332 family protein n=1 Tax=Halobaculum sp. CBA1158 TaxID=2904243 RepID=UPI001F26E923|nr:hypothetical protein [Halobaculum sp. CBA1158]UIP01051.1 hypothetical protein Hbl1158_06770 [Halobaculum sp. CBA1158]